ncbi:MAG: hypothetical protein HFE90_01780 [Firmicutes bacterium]|nr:hypothetical protein [Bacillota bacterium]
MNTLKKMGTFSGIILIALGVLLYACKVLIIDFFTVVAGITVIAAGVYRAVEAMMLRKKEMPYVWIAVSAVIFIIAGIYLIINPMATIRLIGVFIGVFAFMSGFDRFKMALMRKKEGLNYSPTFVTGIIHMIFGVVMCMAPGYGMNVLIMIAGLYMIISGIMVLMSTIWFGDF